MDRKQIQDNLLRVQERIAAAAHRAGRQREEIMLVAVSKTQPAELIRLAYEAGLHHFGENRVQEWEGKRAALGDLQATWHLVGHLQSNKAARAAGLFHSVDSVDDFALAQRLDRARDGQDGERKLRVLLEVRVEEEESKSGVKREAAAALAERVVALSHLELSGLMCIPPFLEDVEQVRPYFRRLRELRDSLAGMIGRELPVLSMGMSHDFEVAIEEGATEVRVGTSIFGSRDAKQMLELQTREGAVTFPVRVQPRASKDEIAGMMGGALKVRLRAPALEGRANEALCDFLAQVLKTPKTAVRIVSGHHSRSKRVEVRGVTELQVLALVTREA